MELAHPSYVIQMLSSMRWVASISTLSPDWETLVANHDQWCI